MNHPHAENHQGFYGLGIAPSLQTALERAKFTIPTPIQLQSIPVALEGKDLVGIAQTGTGKTLAFGIPLIQRLAQVKGKALVVLPTRELALQVEEELRKLGSMLGLRTAVLIGGEAMGRQLQAIRRDPHVVVATPGRLCDHLKQRTINLGNVTILVLDEADRMFDMGFAPQLNQILRAVPKQRQTMLFSATMPPEIMKIAAAHMRLPIRVEVAPSGTAAEHVDQEIYIVPQAHKLPLLLKILKEQRGSVLVFSRTKHGAKRICRQLNASGHAAAEIHANRSLSQRKAALSGFKNGAFRILVATDIAARGIDVKGIELVLNFDLPQDAGDYVHRIGRTGRAGAAGRAISFATPDQQNDVRSIERLIRKSIPTSRHQATPEEISAIPAQKFSASGGSAFGGEPRQFGRPPQRRGRDNRRAQHGRPDRRGQQQQPGGRVVPWSRGPQRGKISPRRYF